MAKPNVEARIGPIVAEILGLDEAEVVPSASLVTDLGADSLDGIEIMIGLEEEFGISIDEEDMEAIVTIKDLVAYLEKRVK